MVEVVDQKIKVSQNLLKTFLKSDKHFCGGWREADHRFHTNFYCGLQLWAVITWPQTSMHPTVNEIMRR